MGSYPIQSVNSEILDSDEVSHTNKNNIQLRSLSFQLD